MRTIAILGCAWTLLAVVPACGVSQAGSGGAADALPPPGYGSLKQSDLALGMRNDELEIRLVPLDERVTRLLARDAYESLKSLVHSRRASIDSVARMYGISSRRTVEASPSANSSFALRSRTLARQRRRHSASTWASDGRYLSVIADFPSRCHCA